MSASTAQERPERAHAFLASACPRGARVASIGPVSPERASARTGTATASSKVMKIICGTDFSEASVAAARTAAKLARRFGDELLLVHAWTSPLDFYQEVITDLARTDERLADKAALEVGNL